MVYKGYVEAQTKKEVFLHRFFKYWTSIVFMKLEARLYTLNPATDPAGKDCPGCMDAIFALREANITVGVTNISAQHNVRVDHLPIVSWQEPRDGRTPFLKFNLPDAEPKPFGAPLLEVIEGPAPRDYIRVPRGKEDIYRHFPILEDSSALRLYLQRTVAPDLPLTPTLLRDLQQMGEAEQIGSYREVGERALVVEPFYNGRLLVVLTGAYVEGSEPRLDDPAHLFQEAHRFEVDFDFKKGEVNTVTPLPTSSTFYFCDECRMEAFRVVPGSKLYRAIMDKRAERIDF